MYVPNHEMIAAQRAYEAYCKYTGNKSLVTGDELPKWDALRGEIMNAWHAAAKEAAKTYNELSGNTGRLDYEPSIK